MKSITVIIACLFCFSGIAQQETYKRTKLDGGKLKYEYFVHKKRDNLVKEFFKLFCEDKSEWILSEDGELAVARITKKGFEIVGSSEGQHFKCEMADLYIDLWYEFAHINSN